MGVRSHNLILIGCDIGCKHYNDDEWEKEDSLYDKYDLNRKSKSGDMVILSDCYSGDYFIIGKIVKVDYDCEGSGLGMHVIDEKTDEFNKAAEEVRKFIDDICKVDADPKYIVMTHYT